MQLVSGECASVTATILACLLLTVVLPCAILAPLGAPGPPVDALPVGTAAADVPSETLLAAVGASRTLELRGRAWPFNPRFFVVDQDRAVVATVACRWTWREGTVYALRFANDSRALVCARRDYRLYSYYPIYRFDQGAACEEEPLGVPYLRMVVPRVPLLMPSPVKRRREFWDARGETVAAAHMSRSVLGLLRIELSGVPAAVGRVVEAKGTARGHDPLPDNESSVEDDPAAEAEAEATSPTLRHAPRGHHMASVPLQTAAATVPLFEVRAHFDLVRDVLNVTSVLGAPWPEAPLGMAEALLAAAILQSDRKASSKSNAQHDGPAGAQRDLDGQALHYHGGR